MTKIKHNAESIYESLKNLITRFDIRPGARITEAQISEYFEVSRTPVRAALQRLELEDFVTIKSKQGCFVRNIDLNLITDYYDVRLELESMALRLIDSKKPTEGLEQLSEDWHPEQLNFGLEINDGLKTAEESYHIELAALSGNVPLVNYLRDVNDKIRVVRRMGFPDELSVTDTYEEHYRICQLLINGDLPTASDELVNHIRKSQDTANHISLNQIYRRQTLFDD